ncbi:MAG: histidinol-phosphate transaminase [Desulfobacterota bacterium]|nr:histidinol-phosphate transaminase [Thermodesulfobacteriota bacterium]
MKRKLPPVKSYIQALVPYPPGKPIDELTREYGITRVIKLASNENPLGPSPGAVAAIQEDLRNLHRYPDGSGYYLKAALSHYLGIEPEGLFIGNGSNEIIELALKTFLVPGDEVLSPFPSFLMYSKTVQALGGKNKFIPLKRYRVDLDGLLEGLGPRSRAIIVCNPNNPTGTVIDRKAWERFLERVPPRVLVLLDEAYIDFVDDPECPQGIDYLGTEKNLLVIRTFSKAYGLAGLRIGYGLARPELTDLMNRVRQPFNVNSLALAGARGALLDTKFYNKTKRIIREGKGFLEENFKDLGLPYVPSQANFILVKVPLPAQELYENLLRRGVIIRSMKSFGLDRHIRVNVGLPAENKKFIKALRRVLEE